MRKLLCTVLALCLSGPCTALTQEGVGPPGQADIVIFSYNRPLQLYALLESTYSLVRGFNEVHVIYRADNDLYDCGYDTVFADFPEVMAEKQGADPASDFKPLTMRAAFDSPSKYILFAVDDIVVKDEVDLHECIGLLEKTNAYGFYLRLGTNLTECYMLNRDQPVPQLDKVGDNAYSWELRRGMHDWGYPNTVDMTLYKKSDIAPDLKGMSFTQPNRLEGSWASRWQRVAHRLGLCFEQTKIVNLPLNLVQNFYNGNRNMGAYSPEELLNIFLEGKKMDISTLYRVKNKGAHMEYRPTFIDR